MRNKIGSILVTGGTGSFGRAFVHFLLHKTNVQRICVYSRGEHAQAAMRQQFDNDPRLRFMVGDVRDAARLERAMHGVDAVVHAAALKRIEVGQYNPDEMVKTNVLGTMNAIESACKAPSVRFVVGLSTDKAYEPASPYGHSKALAEALLLAANITHAKGPKFSVIRYGNVWGAQGSVVPLWRELIAQGHKYVPVTDPDCTRFCMHISDAVQSVWELLEEMNGGELVIPTWLPAYRLGDLAEAMGVGVDIKGLPSWEKMHESMRHDLCSKDAFRLSVDDLKWWLENA